MNNEIGYFNPQLWLALADSKFEGFDYEMKKEEGALRESVEISLTYTIDSGALDEEFDKQRSYLKFGQGVDDVPTEDVINAIVEELRSTLDIGFNAVSSGSLPEGMYRSVHNGQWERTKPEKVYSDYSDLLWRITEEEVGEDTIPSIPRLRPHFLKAVRESEEHTVPPKGVDEKIIGEHINNIRNELESRKGVNELKARLEKNGIDARTAAHVASNMEDLLKPDSEI